MRIILVKLYNAFSRISIKMKQQPPVSERYETQSAMMTMMMMMTTFSYAFFCICYIHPSPPILFSCCFLLWSSRSCILKKWTNFWKCISNFWLLMRSDAFKVCWFWRWFQFFFSNAFPTKGPHCLHLNIRGYKINENNKTRRFLTKRSVYITLVCQLSHSYKQNGSFVAFNWFWWCHVLLLLMTSCWVGASDLVETIL